MVVLVSAAILVTYRAAHQPTVLARAACPVASLNATYGFAFEGFAFSSLKPVAAAGTITFESNGSLSRSFNISIGGTITSVSDSGSYSLDQDCTFTANLPEVGEVWNLIPVEGGKQLKFFVNTPGRVGAGTLTQQ